MKARLSSGSVAGGVPGCDKMEHDNRTPAALRSAQRTVSHGPSAPRTLPKFLILSGEGRRAQGVAPFAESRRDEV